MHDLGWLLLIFAATLGALFAMAYCGITGRLGAMSVVTRSERKAWRERLQRQPYAWEADGGAACEVIPRLLDLIDALEDTQAHAHALLVTWRYQTRDCPACGAPIHTADCALVAALALLQQGGETS